MIQKNDIIEFFNRCAPTWDAEMIRSDEKINSILDNAGVGAGSRVLDVACGTGVLIPDYLARNIGSVTGIDISPAMIKIAERKFTQDNVRFICGDIENTDVGCGYNAIVIYNAFPHFPHPEQLIAHLASLLAPNGILTVAHGASRDAIDAHHNGFASKVSIGLMHADELAAMFARHLTVTTVISTDSMYQVAGKRAD